MAGGTPTNFFKSGAVPSLNYQTHPGTALKIPRADNSHGEAGITAVSTSGGSGQQPSGLANVGRSNPTPSHQGSFRDSVLDNPEQIDDAPYIPPRAEPPNYPALDPRGLYDYQYVYEGGTNPLDSQHGVNWPTSSTSAASQHLLHYSQYSQIPRPPVPHTTLYPQDLHHGQHAAVDLGHVRYGEQPSNTSGSHYRPLQGSSMDSFLLPEIYNDTSAHGTIASQMHHPSMASHASPSSSSISTTNRPPNVSTFSVSPSHATNSTRPLVDDAGPYLRKQLGLSAHESVGLRSLPDPAPGEKPSIPLPMLIKLAIYGSPNKQLTLQEIYTELENRFQWFRDHKREKAWKNSIRHNLSLNKVFRNVPRPITEPGKGSYWVLDVSGGEGYKRPRKRRPKNKVVASEDEDEMASEMDEDRPSPLDPSQHSGGPSRFSATPVEDAQIDPELRGEGHVVGEGRTRSTTRRAAGSPYPQQSPRYQQGPLPVVAGQDAGAPGQPSHRFGQSSFNFPTHSQARPMPVVPLMPLFTDVPSASVMMASTTPTASRPELQHVASYDRTAHILQPTPRSGFEYISDPGGLPAARPVRTHPESQGGDAEPSSPESSSSGSSRTWNAARSRS